MKDLKIGLALGSGAAKGLAHLGVLKALEENEIPVHIISGSSIGAIVGGLYATGKSIENLREFALEFGRKNIARWLDPSFLRTGGFLKGRKIEQALIDFAGDVDFDSLQIPFYAVASDLLTGEEVIINEGSLITAIRASFAIPGIFTPIKMNNKWLVDGALADPIPTGILQDKKCDFIIGVNVCKASSNEKYISSHGIPKIIDVLMQTFSITQQKLALPCMQRADITIIPAVSDHSWTDFSKVDNLMNLGYDATLKQMDEIKQALSKKKKSSFVSRLFKK